MKQLKAVVVVCKLSTIRRESPRPSREVSGSLSASQDMRRNMNELMAKNEIIRVF